jgi:hypothetical protein
MIQYMKVQPELLDEVKKSNYHINAAPSVWCFPEYDPDGLSSQKMSN